MLIIFFNEKNNYGIPVVYCINTANVFLQIMGCHAMTTQVTPFSGLNGQPREQLNMYFRPTN